MAQFGCTPSASCPFCQCTNPLPALRRRPEFLPCPCLSACLPQVLVQPLYECVMQRLAAQVRGCTVLGLRADSPRLVSYLPPLAGAGWLVPDCAAPPCCHLPYVSLGVTVFLADSSLCTLVLSADGLPVFACLHWHHCHHPKL
jgi:hypothetical protein